MTSRSPAAGTRPTGVGTAPTCPARRAQIHATTREFSPNPGHRNRPSSLDGTSSRRTPRAAATTGPPCRASARSSRPCRTRRTAASRTGRAATARPSPRPRRSARWRPTPPGTPGLPVRSLGHQRDVRAAAAAEQHRVHDHALRVVELGGDRRALRRRHGEPRVRCAAGVPEAGVQSRPASQEVLGDLLGHPLPPHVPVVGQRDVGEDDVPVEHLHGGGFGRPARAGATPKNPASGLMARSRPSASGRIQAMSSPIVSTVQPGSVGRQHGEVRLAARRGERRRRGGTAAAAGRSP